MCARSLPPPPRQKHARLHSQLNVGLRAGGACLRGLHPPGPHFRHRLQRVADCDPHPRHQRDFRRLSPLCRGAVLRGRRELPSPNYDTRGGGQDVAGDAVQIYEPAAEPARHPGECAAHAFHPHRSFDGTPSCGDAFEAFGEQNTPGLFTPATDVGEAAAGLCCASMDAVGEARSSPSMAARAFSTVSAGFSRSESPAPRRRARGPRDPASRYPGYRRHQRHWPGHGTRLSRRM